MKSKILSCLALFCAITLHADVTDEATGISFPSEVSFDYEGKTYDLDVTGVSTRKKLIIKVYSVAHYLQKEAQGADRLDKILSDENAKQLTIKWARNVPLEKILSGYHDSFKSVIPSPSPEQQKNIETYTSFFKQEANKGDEHVIRWIPGGIIEVEVNGTKAGTITNSQFARDLWNIWFGNKSVVNKDKLMSDMK